jgi:3-oxoacyl-[acyl-carrier-protein] synthase II
MRRVAVTGMGGVTSMGDDYVEIRRRMRAGETGLCLIPEWLELEDLGVKVGGPVTHFEHEGFYPRQSMRSMGRVAVMAVHSAEKALTVAGLRDDPVVRSGRTGVACGSSYGSVAPTHDFVRFIETGKAGKLNATSYIRMMGHTTPVNIGVHLGLKGRVITTSSACVSGSQAIGYGYEAIKGGHADVMLCGGAEELCPTMAMVFDRLYATSRWTDPAHLASRPFDKTRDGLVTGEGAAILVLEDMEHALARGATIFAEVAGFATNTDGTHISQPSAETQTFVMKAAMVDAGIQADALGFISGHGTATVMGDTVESHATLAAYGGGIPFHTLKGHYGHTLGACGAMEAWLGIEMMRDGWISPIANFQVADSRCAPLDYVGGEGRKIETDHFASNNFAFGGINTSLIFRRVR